MNGNTQRNVTSGNQQQRKDAGDSRDENKYPFGLNNKIFMKVADVKYEDIRCGYRVPPHLTYAVLGEQAEKRGRYRLPPPSTERDVGVRKEKGYLVSVNDHLIALFKIEGQLYAIRDRCPHAGGPLSLGDIEELPGQGLCVKCPWHRFKFRLDTGHACEPEGRPETTLVYAVKVTTEGDIYVAFDALSEKFFSLHLHPGEEEKKPCDVHYSNKPTSIDKAVSDCFKEKRIYL